MYSFNNKHDDSVLYCYRINRTLLEKLLDIIIIIIYIKIVISKKYTKIFEI